MVLVVVVVVVVVVVDVLVVAGDVVVGVVAVEVDSSVGLASRVELCEMVELDDGVVEVSRVDDEDVDNDDGVVVVSVPPCAIGASAKLPKSGGLLDPIRLGGAVSFADWPVEPVVSLPVVDDCTGTAGVRPNP